MNSNSYICRFISENKNWKDVLKEKKIKFVESCSLCIFNYGPECDFSDPVVQEARGIIINLDTLEVVCWPFRKFGNWNESYADKIDWTSARVTDKIDGSLMKLYYWNYKWNWATNGTIDASKAAIPGSTTRTFYDVIRSAVNFKDIQYEHLNKENTYLFELVSPETQVVIRYPHTKLYHIGTRNNLTGREENISIGIEKPEEYSGTKDIEVWKKNAENIQQDKYNPVKEGYVVVDKDFHRIKIKTPAYLTAHRMANNGVLTAETAVDILLRNDEEKIRIFNRYPENKAKLAFYAWQLAELELEISREIALARGIFSETNERKAVAMQIGKDRLSAFGFAAIGNEKTAEEMLKETRPGNVVKLIRKYEEMNG